MRALGEVDGGYDEVQEGLARPLAGPSIFAILIAVDQERTVASPGKVVDLI